MKYEPETGESMEELGKKPKRLLTMTGTTEAVYAGFKHSPLLVAPFFAGYTPAPLLRPSVRFLPYRMRVMIEGKWYHMPIGVIGDVEFLTVLSVLGTVLYRGALKSCVEGKPLMVQLPVWLEQFDLWLTGNCHRVEHAAGLRPGCVADMAGDMLYHMVDTCKTAAMFFLMASSMSVISCLAKAIIVSLVVFLAVVLSLQEMEDLRDRRNQSASCRESSMIGGRLIQTGKAWFRGQGIILFITTGLCTGGMSLVRNPYYVMADTGIGILDALLIFGIGTVLMPWAVFRLAAGDWKQALVLTAIYPVCYFMRQILEVRMMGGQVGLSPLGTLVPVYAGSESSGFFGFILGPLGLLLIEDMMEVWTKERETET